LLAESGQTNQIQEKGPREVRQLVKAVNYLVDRLKMMEQNRRRLLANLVHELGTPLGALQSGTQALLRGAADDPELRLELLQGMSSEMERLKILLTDLAHLNEQATGSLELNLQKINLPEWLPGMVGTWKAAAEEKGLEWTAQISSQLPVLAADPDRLAQAVGNLLSNAIRYTPPGGKILIQSGQEDGKIFIAVEDSGPGISNDEQEKIFIPFFRGKAARRFSEGMGLGLSITRDLVQAHSGEILVESTPGKGSRFIIELPYQQQTLKIEDLSPPNKG
jgi:signal transduction histidine kinase